MLLEELDAGSKITILVGIGSQTLSFDSVLEEPSDKGVLTTPVYRNDKLVGFKTKGTYRICPTCILKADRLDFFNLIINI